LVTAPSDETVDLAYDAVDRLWPELNMKEDIPMRCSSCNKFAANDTSNPPEVELNFEYSPDSVEVQGTVRISLTSECCGEELSEYTFNVEEDVTDKIRLALEVAANAVELPEGVTREQVVKAAAAYPLDSPDLQERMADREWNDGGEVQVKTITGKHKTLKDGTRRWMAYSPRYHRTEYGFEASYTLDTWLPVTVAGVVVELSLELDLEVYDYIQASGMEPLN
jgi:hypothetical protein